MFAHVRSFRSLAAAAALAAALPALAQEDQSYAPPPPPPPESLPWAAPSRARRRPASPSSPPTGRTTATAPAARARPTSRRPTSPPRTSANPGSRTSRWRCAAAWPRPAARPPSGAHHDATSSATRLTLGVELGLRATPQLTVAAFLEGGLGSPGDSTLPTARAPATRLRQRAPRRAHALPLRAVRPRRSLGEPRDGGLRRQRRAAPTRPATTSLSFSGFEFPKLGWAPTCAWPATPPSASTRSGPTACTATPRSAPNGVLVSSGQIDQTTSHSWFMIGPRLTF